jgi:hypothetical protein
MKETGKGFVTERLAATPLELISCFLFPFRVFA